MNTTINAYNNALSDTEKAICELLGAEIDAALPGTESKIWHGHPVWFLDGNPIAGYDKQTDGVRLLFWSGQSFEESELRPVGKFKAAEIKYTSHGQIKKAELRRWLAKADRIQWDYKNIVKRRGVLERLK